MVELKAAVAGDIDSRKQQLEELSLKIHSSPEIASEEFKAAEWLTEYLEKHGFSIEQGTGGLPTAFKASYGEGKPVVAILAEYDALPRVGHACGHNLIATSAVAAGVASKMAVDRLGGSIRVIGTPGEELYGGKVRMAKKGAFDGIDAAMMVHPATENTVAIKSIACQTLDVEFFGRSAHAAARPEEGINALEAMILSFNAIDSLRQHIKDKARIHGIITDGGEAANVVPDHSAGNFVVRAEEDDYLDELNERVLNCFVGAARATGARLEYQWSEVRYASMQSNMTMVRLFKDNMQALGRRMQLFNANIGSFSTDMGNVSRLVPGIHPMVSIAPAEVLIHSPQFKQAAVSEAGMKGLLDAAGAMAMTVVDLLAAPELMEKAREEFRRAKR